MKILLSPQVADDVIEYKFKDEKIEVTIGNITDIFDFTGVPDGRLELRNKETGEELINTPLPINPILSAKKENGILYLELMNWISENASYEEMFPEWIDSSQYTAPKENEYSDNKAKTSINNLEIKNNEESSKDAKIDESEDNVKDWSDF